MSIFDGLKKWFSRSRIATTFSEWGAPTRSAVNVDLDVTLQASAMLCAARVIAEGIGQCPVKLYEEEDQEDSGRTVRKPARNHPLYRLISYEPCWLTSFEFFETLTIHAAIEGQGIALKNRGGVEGGPILEMIPMLPGDVRVEWNEFNEPVYRLLRLGRVLPRTEVSAEMLEHYRTEGWVPRSHVSLPLPPTIAHPTITPPHPTPAMPSPASGL